MTQPVDNRVSPLPSQNDNAITDVRGGGKLINSGIAEIWACGMLLSFFWELPLWYMTNMDRINPRFYDIFFLIGLAIFGSKLFFKKISNPIYRCWRNIVVWFTICSLFYSSFTDWAIAQHSLLCAIRYIQGLLVLKMLLLLPPKQVIKMLPGVCWVGLGVICLYCFFEYMGRIVDPPIKEIEITFGKNIKIYGNLLFGPLSFSYFHLAQLLPLAFSVIAFNLLFFSKKSINTVLLSLALLLCWPVLWSGSRTGLGLLAVCLIMFLWRFWKQRNLMFWIFAFIILITLMGLHRFAPDLLDDAASFNRYEGYSTSDVHSVGARIQIWETLVNLQHYTYWYWLPFFGAGFNFAPLDNRYRIGYGIHCSPLYPFEQAGIVGLVLFVIFVVISLRAMWKARRDNPIAYAGIAYLSASLICGITGAHNFWREFSTGNLNTFILIVLCLSASHAFEQPREDDADFTGK